MIERAVRALSAAAAFNGISEASLRRGIGLWEEILTLVVDPRSGRVADREERHRLLGSLLASARIPEADFWRLSPARRSRLFLSHFSRASRDVPGLEITSFDLEKASKERFRREPLTIGAAWHHGYWRSYFSHAAITHPANDGLREEFSTAWEIARREPAVLFHTAEGVRWHTAKTVRLDLPMIVGPFPHSDGITFECAYIDAIARSDAHADLSVRTLVAVDAVHLGAHRDFYTDRSECVLWRVPLASVAGEREIRELALQGPGLIEIVVPQEASGAELRRAIALPAAEGLLVSTALRYGPRFWEQLLAAAGTPGVAMVVVWSGALKSYQLIPEADRFLKDARLRSRIQLVTAGGDTDALASAAAVYEAVLLGANGGAMTHLAELALCPDLAEAYRGADAAPILASAVRTGPAALADLALHTLSCWQHSILDFLSCMGIDDIQKTSGNQMAITVTEDWIRETDRLATSAFGLENAALNLRRVAAEPVPPPVAARYRVSRLLGEVSPDLPMAAAAQVLAHADASYHLNNTNRNLTADHLSVLYKMAAGRFPELDDFFVDGDMGPWSLDGVRVRLSRESVQWSLERLRRSPEALDYIGLVVARGFDRTGAAPPGASCVLSRSRDGAAPLATFTADARGGFRAPVADDPGEGPLFVVATPSGSDTKEAAELLPCGSGEARGASCVRRSASGRIVLKRARPLFPAAGRYGAPASGNGSHDGNGDGESAAFILEGDGVRVPVHTGPVNHASISLGAASEDFLGARVEGNAGLSLVSSGEGGPIRLAPEVMAWESVQAASGHFGITPSDLRLARDVEIKINQGAKPGKGGRLAGAKVTPQVSRARNIPVGADALSPDPKHDIYSIEDMPAEVWLWLHFGVHCGIKISGSNYTRYVAAGMWSNFVVDYLLIDAGIGGSGNYHADSSHVGWPDIFRTVLSTHHALLQERVVDDRTGLLVPIRDLNGAAFGAGGGTRLVASGGLRGEMDMLKVFLAGADAVVEASIGKAVAFGCNQCGNCHLDCPRGGITTKPELTMQNDRRLMRRRFHNWSVLNLVKIAVLIDALNREMGWIDAHGTVLAPGEILDDVRKLRGRADLLIMPEHPPAAERPKAPAADAVARAAGLEAPEMAANRTRGDQTPGEHDSCRVGSLAVSEPVDVEAIWEAARLSPNGGNNRGGGIGFAGFAPEPLRSKTCLFINTIGPDRAQTAERMLEHLSGLWFFDGAGRRITREDVRRRLPEFRVPVREIYAGEDGWQRAGFRENVGDFTFLFTSLDPEVLVRYGRKLLASPGWLQRRVKYGDLDDAFLAGALETAAGAGRLDGRARAFARDVLEEYYTTLAHILDSRFYRTHGEAPAGKLSDRRRGFVVSYGEDLGAIKVSGWAHAIPEYFDFDRFWSGYPGAAEAGGVTYAVQGHALRTSKLHAHAWGMHHRYPTNSPAIDAEGRGNPAGAHPFKAYNLLLMHNGEQVGVDSTSSFLVEYAPASTDESMGEGAALYDGDSLYERKALTDTEYAAYLVDFTRRVLGLSTEDATQIISPITGLDLEACPPDTRERYRLIASNYVPLTPTGPYKFTILETRERAGGRVAGFRENMDIKFLRPHEIVASVDPREGGARVAANGSEAKIADAMLRVLRRQGLLGDASADLRVNMRPGGRPGSGETGGVLEAFTGPSAGEFGLRNRFGEEIAVARAGSKPEPRRALAEAAASAGSRWRGFVEEQLGAIERALLTSAGAWSACEQFVRATLAELHGLSFDDYRFLTESALVAFAERSDGHRAVALDLLTELRKRVQFADLGGKALSGVEYLTDGGDGPAGIEGGIYRLLAATPSLWDAWGRARHMRLDASTREDLIAPADPEHDVLVVDFSGFASESFGRDSAARFLSEAVRRGWRRITGFRFRGGPRYVGTNLVRPDAADAHGVRIDLYGREFGDFLGALLEGAEIRLFGQGQSHVGMKANDGSIFVLQDILNTGMYAAHGGTLNVWDSGSRFAVAGQNKVYLAGGHALAPGFKTVHFGSPNEYAFEYLMSGGENSIHVVLGLAKPDARGLIRPRPRPYTGKFLLSGAAAGRVYMFDPDHALDPDQHLGSHAFPVAVEEWGRAVAPFLSAEAAKRGLPLEVTREGIRLLLDGGWRDYAAPESFRRLQPEKEARALRAADAVTGFAGVRPD